VTEAAVLGSTVLITGANSGIGRATALALARRGARLFLAGRSAAGMRPLLDELEALGHPDAQFLSLDLASLASVRACAEQVQEKYGRLDVLINNAGVAGKRGLTADGFELLFGVNHLGHFLLTELLTPRLSESARGQVRPGRVVNVSSIAHYDARGIDWPALRRKTGHITAMPEYQVSKLCNVLHAKELARRFERQSVNVHTYALHPGVIASNIWRQVPWPIRPLLTATMKSPEEGAQTSVFCATADSVGPETGLYYDSCRAVEPSRLAQDESLARELFERSLEYVQR